MSALNLAFVLFNYFPYGGLQRDCLRIAESCHQLGWSICFYAERWQGAVPAGHRLQLLPSRRFSNHARAADFAAQLQQHLQQQPASAVIGFNRLPGLDVYYAADSCYLARMRQRHWMHRLTPRYRQWRQFEQAVFAPSSKTQILALTQPQILEYQSVYQTPNGRFVLLPPGITKTSRTDKERASIRAQVRQTNNIAQKQLWLLFVGSGFRVKGLDRAIRAVAALPPDLLQTVRLSVIGQDKVRPFQKLAKRLGIAERVQFLGGRDDLADFLLSADLLLHPAHHESAGKVLLESVVAGLPVLATNRCGYASHIQQADAGKILASPFQQQQLNQVLATILKQPQQRQIWSENGIRYGQEQDLYRLPEQAAQQITAWAHR